MRKLSNFVSPKMVVVGTLIMGLLFGKAIPNYISANEIKKKLNSGISMSQEELNNLNIQYFEYIRKTNPFYSSDQD